MNHLLPSEKDIQGPRQQPSDQITCDLQISSLRIRSLILRVCVHVCFASLWITSRFVTKYSHNLYLKYGTLQYTEYRIHRMVEVGRISGVHLAQPLPEQGHHEHGAQDGF